MQIRPLTALLSFLVISPTAHAACSWVADGTFESAHFWIGPASCHPHCPMTTPPTGDPIKQTFVFPGPDRLINLKYHCASIKNGHGDDTHGCDFEVWPGAGGPDLHNQSLYWVGEGWHRGDQIFIWATANKQKEVCQAK
jgi:hypothetical protein